MKTLSEIKLEASNLYLHDEKGLSKQYFDIKVAFEAGAEAQRQLCSEDMPEEWIKNMVKETPLAKLTNP